MLLWALSGILHPIMGNWFKAEIAHKFLPPQAISTTENIQPPSQVIPHNLDLQFLRLVNIDKSVAYLVETTEKEFHLFSAKTGEKLELNSYLTQQARLYADDPHSPLKSISRQDHFNNHYSTINRYLPVYRVALERKDGLEIMIDPRTGRMARFDKPYLRTLKTLFGWFHTYSFLGKGDNIFRVTVVTTLSTLGILIGLSGIANLILFRTKTASGRERRMGKGRRIHRILGGITFIFFLNKRTHRRSFTSRRNSTY